MNWSAVAAILLGLAVLLGAFGAHGLQNRLDTYSMGIYRGAVSYQFIHALGLLVVSILPKIGVLRAARAAWVCRLLVIGIVLFSGSLYLLAVTGVSYLGAITPVGGLAFVAAWFTLAWGLARQEQ